MIRLEPDADLEEGTAQSFAGGPLDWLSPFSIMCGFGLVVGYALIGACWLVMKTAGGVEKAARHRISAERPVAASWRHGLGQHRLLDGRERAVVDAGRTEHPGQTGNNQQPRLPRKGEVYPGQRHQQADPGQRPAPPEPAGHSSRHQSREEGGGEPYAQRQADQRRRQACSLEMECDQHRRETKAEGPKAAGCDKQTSVARHGRGYFNRKIEKLVNLDRGSQARGDPCLFEDSRPGDAGRGRRPSRGLQASRPAPPRGPRSLRPRHHGTGRAAWSRASREPLPAHIRRRRPLSGRPSRAHGCARRLHDQRAAEAILRAAGANR